jgi:tetratricopeptide (TPR) repeat protein
MVESDVKNATTAPRKTRRWGPVVSVLVVPVLLLGLIEGGLRLFGAGFPTDVTVPCTLQGQPAACYNLFFPAPFFPPGMIKTPQAYAIPVAKSPETFRIFVLGESAAMGDPDPAYAFSRYLEVMLRSRYPGMKFEVVNTGSVAINSHVLLPMAKGLAQQHPDLFIIYSGNNEVVGPYGPGTALTSTAMSLPVIRASILARSTRIGQLLTRVGEQKKEWGGMEMFLDKQVSESSPLMKDTYANFEQNLRDTIAVARKSGAGVIVSTVATNLKDCAPFASEHRPSLKPDEERAWTALLQEGAELETERSYAEALKHYFAAEAIDNQYAELEFRVAHCLWMLGDYASAKGPFQRARDLDTLRFRADTRINEINRTAVASGAELVDAEDIFSRQSPGGIIGSDLVYEHVHLTPLGNYLLARAIFLQIASKLPGQTERVMADAGVLSEAECERRLAFTEHDRVRIANEMLQRLQRPPFSRQVNHSDQVLRLMLQAQNSEENPAQTDAEYQWAVAQKPDDRILRYNYGLFLFEHNRAAAVSQLRLSRPWDGFPVFTPDGELVQ